MHGRPSPLRQWCISALFQIWNSPIFAISIHFHVFFVSPYILWPWCIYASHNARTGRPCTHACIHKLCAFYTLKFIASKAYTVYTITCDELQWIRVNVNECSDISYRHRKCCVTVEIIRLRLVKLNLQSQWRILWTVSSYSALVETQRGQATRVPGIRRR